MKVLILYASQTGNSESMSNDLEYRLNEKGISVVRYAMNDFSEKLEAIQHYDFILILCSTTGNGEIPENGTIFWKKIKNRKQPVCCFQGKHYRVCALGDTNYSMFCFPGKNLDKRIQQLGGVPLDPVFCIDAVDDEEEQFNSFCKEIFDRLIV